MIRVLVQQPTCIPNIFPECHTGRPTPLAVPLVDTGRPTGLPSNRAVAGAGKMRGRYFARLCLTMRAATIRNLCGTASPPPCGRLYSTVMKHVEMYVVFSRQRLHLCHFALIKNPKTQI